MSTRYFGDAGGESNPNKSGERLRSIPRGGAQAKDGRVRSKAKVKSGSQWRNYWEFGRSLERMLLRLRLAE